MAAVHPRVCVTCRELTMVVAVEHRAIELGKLELREVTLVEVKSIVV